MGKCTATTKAGDPCKRDSEQGKDVCSHHNPDHPRKCSAKKVNGGICNHFAIRGGTVCTHHGGRIPNVKAAAKRRVALASARKLLGIPEDIEPTEALLHAVRVSAGDMLALAAVVNDDPKWIAPYERAVERVAKVSKAALDAGIAERRVQMAEAQATQMMQVLQAGLDAAKLNPEQQAKARLAMVKEIHRIEGKREKAIEQMTEG